MFVDVSQYRDLLWLVSRFQSYECCLWAGLQWIPGFPGASMHLCYPRHSSHDHTCISKVSRLCQTTQSYLENRISSISSFLKFSFFFLSFCQVVSLFSWKTRLHLCLQYQLTLIIESIIPIYEFIELLYLILKFVI